jgi:hypothetical protein
MIIVFLLALTIVLIITFFRIEKSLNLFQNIFMYFVLSFLITTSFDILILNLEYIKLSSNFYLVLLFFLMQTSFFPLIIILYFNYLSSSKSRLRKFNLTILCLASLFLIEYTLLSNKIIIYKKWTSLKSALYWISLLLTIYLLNKAFNKSISDEVDC